MAQSSLKLSNNGLSTLPSGASSVATSIAVASGEGSKFPALTVGQYFMATLVQSSGAFEIVRVTARSGDTLTATRAQEGTTALTFAAGSRIEHRLTAGTVTEELSRIDADLLGKVDTGDSRLSDAREWTAATVTQAAAEAGTETTRRAWTVQRVWQAIAAWWAASADKAKLDGIQAGAQVNAVTSVAGNTGAVTATQLLDAVKTVDGASSGLDADTLDGTHASGFATAAHTHSYVPIDAGSIAVGTMLPCTTTNAVAAGATTPGTNLTNQGQTISSGTWRNIGKASTSNGTFQRIA